MNYKRENKWLGIIDYKSLVIVLIYIFFIGYMLSLLPFNIEILIYIFIILVIPVVALFCININNGSVVDIINIILKFKLNNYVYTDLKNTNNYKKEKYINYTK
jgi:hypothetical protein